MKICDRCNSETATLSELVPEFDSLEVCDACFRQFEDRCLEIQKRLAGVRDRARRRAFIAWKGEDFEPANVKAVRSSWASICAAIYHVHKARSR